VKPLSTLGYYQLAFMGKPATDRLVYQLIKKNKFQSFVEIGLGTGDRCQQILRVAGKFSDKPIRYTGIDMFDARPENSLKLIDMHKTLKAFDAKTQLVPGPVGPSIERIANSHLRTDMIVISPGTQRSELESVIFRANCQGLLNSGEPSYEGRARFPSKSLSAFIDCRSSTIISAQMIISSQWSPADEPAI